MKQTKKQKIAFGIFQDGLTVKIAQMVKDEDKIRIQNLQETVLSYPLFPKKEAAENKGSEDTIESLEEDLNIPDFDETEGEEGFEDFEEEEEMNGIIDLQNLLLNFPLENGILSFNAGDAKISYQKFEKKFAANQIVEKNGEYILTKEGFNKLKSAILSKDEQNAKTGYQVEYFINSDKSILAWVYRGENDLLLASQEINKLVTKKKFTYGYINPNEIALMNLVRRNYDYADDEYVLILYIGIDYKAGIVMQGKDHVKTFPIIVSDSKPANMRRAIFSKVTLEQDLSHIHFTQNILLAGEYIKDEDVAYFVLKFSYRSKVSRLEINKDKSGQFGIPVDVAKGMENEITSESVAKYSIPISLAWQTLDSQNEYFIDTNLMPEEILVKQKPFKVDWHGYVLLGAIFFFTLSGTLKNLELKRNIRNSKYQIEHLAKKLTQKRNLKLKLDKIKEDLEILKKNIKKTKKLSGNRKQWNYILNVLAEAFSKNRNSWIVGLRSDDTKFLIRGFTLDKRNVIEFAKLFPSGQIKEITKNKDSEKKIKDISLWEFNIEFSYPKALNLD